MAATSTAGVTGVRYRWAWVKASRGSKTGLEKLRDEVNLGKSAVLVNGSGGIERIAAIVALRIEREDGYLFAQLGKREEDKMTPACKLPGGKQERGELLTDSVKRLLEGKFALLAGCVQVVRTLRQVESKESKEFGVRTKYMRTVFVSRLDQSLRPPSAGR